MHPYLILTLAIVLTSCTPVSTTPVKQTPETPTVKTTQTIPPIPTEKTLRMGVVELAVADLTRMRDFYSEVV